MNLTDIQNKYNNYVGNECTFGKNLVNPSRCSSSSKYYAKLKDFIKQNYEDSLKETKNSQEKLLKSRMGSKERKIYPIVNHDFDYKTAYMKDLNPYSLGITNKPTIYNLIKAPEQLFKYYDGLVKKPYPNENTVAGVDDIIAEDKRRAQIKNIYRQMDSKPPYPSFRKDYPGCRYPTTGKHASSYFIKIGKCKSNIPTKKDCEKAEFTWVPNKQKFPKIAVKLATKSKDQKAVNKIESGTCYKPQFAYIDNTAKGLYGQDGLAPSIFNDMLNLTPDKLLEVLAGNSVENSGILPCVEDFSNMVEKKDNKYLSYVSILFIVLAILYFVYKKTMNK